VVSRPLMLRCVVGQPGKTPEFRSLTDDEIAQARREGKIVVVDPEDDIAPDDAALTPGSPGWEDDASKWFRLNGRIKRRLR
jgi:hypothetical protein